MDAEPFELSAARITLKTADTWDGNTAAGADRLRTVEAERDQWEERYWQIQAFLGSASPKAKHAYDGMLAQQRALEAERNRLAEQLAAVARILDG